MPSMKFKKAFPLVSNSPSVHRRIGRARDILFLAEPTNENSSFHLFYSVDEGETWVYTAQDAVNQTGTVNIAFENDNVFVTYNSRVYTLNFTTMLFEETADVSTISALTATVLNIRIDAIAFFKGLYHVVVYNSSSLYSFRTTTADFVAFSTPIQLFDNVNALTSFWGCINDGDTLIGLYKNGTTYSTDGASFVRTNAHTLSNVDDQIEIFEKKLYFFGRASANDLRLYSTDGSSTTEHWNPSGTSGCITVFDSHADFTAADTREYARKLSNGAFESYGYVRPAGRPKKEYELSYKTQRITVAGKTACVLVSSYVETDVLTTWCSVDNGASWQPFITYPSAPDHPYVADMQDSFTARGISMHGGDAAMLSRKGQYAKVHTYIYKDVSRVFTGAPFVIFGAVSTELDKFICIDEQTLIAIYAPSTSFSAMFWKSSNAGASWAPYTELSQYLQAQDFKSAAPMAAQFQKMCLTVDTQIHDDGGQFIYMAYALDGNNVCVLRYDRDADSWTHTKVNIPEGIFSSQMAAILGVGADISFVVQGAYVNGGYPTYAYTSADCGKTFARTHSSGIPGLVVAGYVAVSNNNYVITRADYAIRSGDKGQTWEFVMTRTTASNYIDAGLVGTANGFVGFSSLLPSQFMYSADGRQWFSDKTDNSLNAILGEYVYGQIDVEAAISYGGGALLSETSLYGATNVTYPDGVPTIYPAAVTMDSFWTDFVNCIDGE